MRIYLAGPEVFLADAAALAAAKSAICVAHGCVGVFPTDPSPIPLNWDEPEWLRIYRANEAHIRACDALIANLTPFRGASADPGTVFELGFMRALGRPIHGYSNSVARFGSRTLGLLGRAARRRADGGWEDAEGMAVEEFDRHDNLMLDGSIAVAGGAFESEDVAPEDRWRNLKAFERCVAALTRRTPEKR